MKKKELRWPSVGHLLEDAASKNGDKTIFIYEKEHLSFAEANSRVNRAANALRDLGVNKGDRISIMLPNGLDFPIVWLAIGKLGAVTVPTNVTYQAHDLEYILNDSETSVMVIHPDYLPTLEKVRAKIPSLREVAILGPDREGYHSFEELTQKASDSYIIQDVNENDLVNIQYTSGTTGFPKGCMLTHRYWLLIAEGVTDFSHIEPDDVDLTAQPCYYVDFPWNATLCMMYGIPLVIMPRFSPSKFWPTVKDNSVTFFYVLGTMPNFLLTQKENPELEKNHKLRFVLCSGIVPKLHETFEKRWNVPWREVFGMTETGGDLMVPLEDKESVGTGAVGKPMYNKEVRVTDEDGNELPDGEIGEIVIKGEPMMLGYWNKPEATAQTIKDGWLHTGDLAYKDEKGYFHVVGRIKDMIRRSAENISAAEVEGVLAEHPKITTVAALPVPDELRGEEVKVYIILKEGETKESVPPGEIIEFTKKRLAYFKVPRYIEYADDLPRTPSERVEKQKLIQAKDDLRKDSYDAVDELWR